MKQLCSPVLALGLVLSGCAPGGPGDIGGTGVASFTQAGRIGPNDGSDSCYAQAQALDNTGNFFGADILTGAAAGAAGGALLGGLIGGNLKSALIGAAAGGVAGAAGGYWAALQAQGQNDQQIEATVTDNLTTENQQIDATQVAFNNDMDCRFGQAQAIRSQYAAGTITLDQAQAQMAQVKQWAQRDLALAQEINTNIQSRGAQFDTAVTNLNNGAPPPVAPPQALDEAAAMRRDTPLYLRPDPNAPVVGQTTRHQQVTLTGTSGDYALVQTDDGTQGFAPLVDVGKPGSTRAIHVVPQAVTTSPDATPVQQLDGSNAASRDAFAQNVSVSQTAVANGFQLSS